MSRTLQGSVDISEIECLISWPKGTRGYVAEYKLISDLLEMCKQHGFGRVPQIANAIEAIWRNPEAREKYEQFREEQSKTLNHNEV